MENNYYIAVGGTICNATAQPKYTEYTREEILATIDPFDWDTIEPWLKRMNYPALPGHYIDMVLRYRRNDDYSKTYLGKYLVKMHLYSFCEMRYKDSYLSIMDYSYFTPQALKCLNISIFDNNHNHRPLEELAHDYTQAILKLCKEGQYDKAKKYFRGEYLYG